MTVPLPSDFPWLVDLAPADDIEIPAPASGNAQRAQVVSVLGAEALDWGVQLGARVADQITRGIPVYARNEDGFEKLRTGTESTTLRLLMVLAGATDTDAVTAESLAAATDFVQRRISLDDMVRGIQLGHGTMASAFLAGCAQLAEPEDTLAQMRAMTERMFQFFDLFVSEMSAHYRVEQQRWEGSDTGVKLAVVTGFLEGTVPEDVATRKLGYPIDGPQMAIVAIGAEADAASTVAAVGDALAAAGCSHRLALSAGPGIVWAWGSPTGEERIAAALSGAALPPGTHAASGRVAQGHVGFAQSHREALAAISVVRAGPPSGRIVAYEETDLVSLLLADPERAWSFTAHELGPLASPSPQVRELRRTLAAFIDERGSPHAAAQRLNVSRNTVGYRVQRAEELLGRSVNVRRLQLRCALLLQEIAEARMSDEQRTPRSTR